MFWIFQPVAQRRLECAVILATTLFIYNDLGYDWNSFASLFLLPDIAILTYFVTGPKIGGLAYNMAHCFVFPIVLGLYGYVFQDTVLQQLALIWLAHCAFDRTIGWGLKFDDSFCNTDMGVRSMPIKIKQLA
jgi:hypothetical protein